MKNLRELAARVAVKGKGVAGVVLASSSVLAGAAFAQTTPTMDVSSVATTIGLGVAAAGVIGAAWVGFKYLQKVWNRV